MWPELMLDVVGLGYPVVGDVVLDVIDDLPGVSVRLVVILILLRLHLRPVLAATP